MSYYDDEDEPLPILGAPPTLPPAPTDPDAPSVAPRRRFGAVVAALGPRARGNPGAVDATKATEARGRAAKAAELAKAGRNKGAEKGYGMTGPSVG